jgi:hypothetical protein
MGLEPWVVAKLSGFISPGADKAYFFTGNQYVRYDVAADAVDDGYPRLISDDWPGVFEEDVDAVVPWPGGSVFFFRGGEYVRWDPAAQAVGEGYPRPIAGNWPGLFEAAIDAGMLWSGEEVAYFFSGGEYVRYDVAADAAAEGYPRPIAGNWPGLFESGLDAALMWPSGNAYFFCGDEYTKYDPVADAAAEGYPLPIAGNWDGLPISSNGAEPAPGQDASSTTAASRRTVREYFPEFSRPLEGRVPYMYPDIKQLVTVAVGNLIDDPEAAAALPFVHKDDGAPATREEILAEWQRVKDDPTLASRGHKAAGKITTLMLTETAIDELVRSKFDSNEAALRRAFADWASWPADAQLGAHSIAWAGAGFPAKWPKFRDAAARHDWTTAAEQSRLDTTGNPGVADRNTANSQLFTNAAAVERDGLDRAVLYYPTAL